MKTFLRVKYRLPVVLLLVSQMVSGQTVFDWSNTTDGTFTGGGFNRWYDNFLATFLQTEPTGSGVILRFNNNDQPANINNVPGTYSIYQLIFGGANTLPRTISGNPIRLVNYLGTNTRIENQSTATHILSLPLEADGDPAEPLEINPQSGGLTFNGTINNQGSPIHILGGGAHTVTFNGILSGTGGLQLLQTSVLISAAAHTYTGTTTISAGVVRPGANVTPSANGPFGNHASGFFLNAGTLQVNTAVFSRPITIGGSSTTIDAFASARTVSAPIDNPAGTNTLSLGGFFSAGSSGQDLTLSGSITNSGGVLSLNKVSTSTVTLSGSNNFNGSLTVSGGVLRIQSPASISSNNNLILSGGTFRVDGVPAASVVQAGSLRMTASSTLDLGTGSNAFDLLFSGSGPSFTGTLTITNWSAVNGKRIRFADLTHINQPAVLAQIQFSGYGPGAEIRNGDELWPAGLYFTQASGNFGNTATWVGGVVPPANSSIVVLPGHIVTLDNNYSLRGIDVAGTLNCNANFTLTIGNSLSKLTNQGGVNFTNGTVVVNAGGATVDGTVQSVFNNLTLNGTLSTQRTPLVNGILLLNSAGAVTTNTIQYGPASTLQYNKNGSWLMAREWNFYTTPSNVIVGGNTNINFTTSAAEIGNMACTGNLTIAAGSALNLELKRGSLTVGGNIQIDGALVFPLAVYGGLLDLYLSGNWVRTATAPAVVFNNRAVWFRGNTNTSITGPAPGVVEEFRVINMDKAAGRTVTLNNPVNVSAELRLNSGYFLASSLNYFSISHFSAVTFAGSVNSFIHGPMRKIGQTFPSTASFTFPIGKIVGSEYHYRPITISAPGASTHEFIAEFQRSDPHKVNGNSPINPLAIAAGLSHISLCEYWDLTKSPGATNVDVTLSWSNHPSGRSRCNVGPYVNDLTRLVVVPYYNGMWGDQNAPYYGRTSTTGTANPTTSPFLSTITWNGPADGSNIDSYLKFTLGSTDWRFNPLPYQLLQFDARTINGTVQLDWTANGNDQIKEYRIQYSNNGLTFTDFNVMLSDGNSRTTYRQQHEPRSGNLHFYRLIAVTHAGVQYSSGILRVQTNLVQQGLSLYPNPVTGNSVQLQTGTLAAGTYEWQLVSPDGKVLAANRFRIGSLGMQAQLLELPKALAAGVYRFRIQQESGTVQVLTMMVIR